MVEIVRACSNEVLEWAFVVLNTPYSQQPTRYQKRKQEWNGELDMVLIAPNRLFIYELKSGHISILLGRSDERPWKVERSGNVRWEKSWFNQTGKARYFFLQTFLNECKAKLEVPPPNHFVVDARVVCPNGSDLSKFYYKVPTTVSADEIVEVCDNLPEDEADFVMSCYPMVVEETGELRRTKVNREKLSRLSHAWEKAGVTPRVAKWFKPLVESDVAKDLKENESTSFRLSYTSGKAISNALKNGFDALS